MLEHGPTVEPKPHGQQAILQAQWCSQGSVGMYFNRGTFATGGDGALRDQHREP